MPGQRGQQLTLVRIPQTHQAIRTATGQHQPIRAKGQRACAMTMTFQGKMQLIVGQMPKMDGLFSRTTGQQALIGADRQGIDAAMSIWRRRWSLASNIRCRGRRWSRPARMCREPLTAQIWS